MGFNGMFTHTGVYNKLALLAQSLGVKNPTNL